MAQQQEQLGQYNEQLLGCTHTETRRQHDAAWRRRRFGRQRSVRDDWQQHLQQLCHRLQQALFNAAMQATRLAFRGDLGTYRTASSRSSRRYAIRRWWPSFGTAPNANRLGLQLLQCCCCWPIVARGLGLLVLVLVLVILVLFMLELLLLLLRKARVVTVSSTYHRCTVCAGAVCTYAGTHASRQ